MEDNPDFSGYATKVGLECTDGRTIMPDAFSHQHQTSVPLVWQHQHDDPSNILGHVLLENRADGVYAKAYFNKSQRAQEAKEAISHKDITQMSIWANKLLERGKKVMNGTIREVSLVISGANPGALIDSIAITHGDGSLDVIEGEAIIYTGELIHTVVDEVETTEDEVSHETETEKSIADVIATMDEEQKTTMYYLVGEGIRAAKEGTDSSLEASSEETDESSVEHSDTESTDTKEGSEMSNVFEDSDTSGKGATLSHDDLREIVSNAERTGSLKHAFAQYAQDHLEHGINDINLLFPDANLIGNEPEFLSRRMEWVNTVLSATRKSPFARIRTIAADITEDEARAKGYVTGEFKREEFFGLTRRETTPQTVYKKQKLERDDIIDITDLDVVTWLKGEMRVMLDEELARAALIGDGRDIAHTDKIGETHIRPVATDHELYTSVVNCNLNDANSNIQELIDVIVSNRSKYKGSGMPSLFTSETIISRLLLLKDAVGRRLYKNLAEVADEIRVAAIVPVEAMDELTDVVAIMVNMADYNFGTDRGGEVNMFDDFDIDYNNYKYLIETRVSGALVRLKSAIVYKTVASTDVLLVPTVPTFVPATGVVTIPTQTGVVYKNDGTGATLTAGAQTAIAAGATIRIRAEAQAGYYFATSDNDVWVFTRDAA